MEAFECRFTLAHHRLTARLVAVPFLLCALSCGNRYSPAGPSSTATVGSSSTMTFFVDGPSEVGAGTTASFRAILRGYVNDSAVDVTQESAWSSSNPSVLSIDRGVATGFMNGVATLEAHFRDQRNRKQVVVKGVPLRSSAVLAIEQFSITVYELGRGRFEYGARFLLRETSNTSGATIQNVLVEGANGDGGNTGPGCWGGPIRVPPGGTVDTFLTDAGLSWLSYCAPGIGGSTATPQLRLVVSFIDDNGMAGTIEASASAPNRD